MATWPRRVLVCGDREWTDEHAIRCVLARWNQEPLGISEVIHGDCRGADRIAGTVAKELGIPVREFPADWKRYGRKAGPIRNRRMLREGKPGYVFAFHDNIDASRGTKDMVEAAKAAGVDTTAYTAREARRYRPSNGTEGDYFRARFCDRCVRDLADPGCSILTATLCFDTEDEHYPDDWTFDAAGDPICTAFDLLSLSETT